MTTKVDKLVQIPVGKIHPAAGNPNRQNEVITRALRESIELFGFIEPVTVRPHPEIEGEYQLIGGEHRWREAGEQGFEDIPAVVLDLDDAAARKLMIVLNETTGDADVVLLGKLLRELEAELSAEDFARALPFTPGELEHLLEIGSTDWDQFGGSYNPNDDPPPPDLRALTIELPSARMDELGRYLEIIRRELSLAGDAEAVLEAAGRVAKELNQG